MIIIAEISDKMGTVPTMWGFMAIFAAPFLIGMVGPRTAWSLLAVAVAFSAWLAFGAWHEAFVEPGMSEAIRNEMGSWWIINSIASCFVPAVVAGGVLWWTIRNKRGPNQASEDIGAGAPNPQR